MVKNGPWADQSQARGSNAHGHDWMPHPPVLGTAESDANLRTKYLVSI